MHYGPSPLQTQRGRPIYELLVVDLAARVSRLEVLHDTVGFLRRRCLGTRRPDTTDVHEAHSYEYEKQEDSGCEPPQPHAASGCHASYSSPMIAVGTYRSVPTSLEYDGRHFAHLPHLYVVVHSRIVSTHAVIITRWERPRPVVRIAVGQVPPVVTSCLVCCESTIDDILKDDRSGEVYRKRIQNHHHGEHDERRRVAVAHLVYLCDQQNDYQSEEQVCPVHVYS